MLQSLEELTCFECILVRTECGETEITCTVFSESFTGCADDAESVKNGVEEFPATHVVRTLEPDVR